MALSKRKIIFFTLAVCGTFFSAWARVPTLKGRATYVAGEILVRLQEGASPDSRMKALAAVGTARPLRHPDLFKVKLKAGLDVTRSVEQMKNDPAVKYAQPNYRYYAMGCAGPTSSTDQYYASPENWPFLKISAPQAWALFSTCPIPPGVGSTSVTVAVLDSGISRYQPDLKQVPLIGFNAICDVQEQDPSCTCNASVDDSGSVTATMDDYGHGTYVTGIINASWCIGCPNPNTVVNESDSSYYPVCGGGGSTPYTGKSDQGGFAGLAPGITILAVKILDCTGSGTTDSIVAGTDFAVAAGARVLNFSLGSSPTGGIDPAEQEALDNALAQNCVIVAAAGNDSDISQGQLAPVDYPAAYPPVIAVGATDENDNVANYSNGGANLEMVAPGGSADAFTGNAITDSGNKVFSTFLSPLPFGSVTECGFEPLITTSVTTTDPNFGAAAGTSAATPFVTATAALILSMYPNLTNTQVSQAIVNNTDSLNNNQGWNSQTGYGRLNVYKALLNANNPGAGQVTHYLNTFNSPNPFYVDQVGTTNITIAITQPQPVELIIYDTGGEVVFRKNYTAGELNNNPADPQFKSYYVPWNGHNGAGQEVKSGVYFYSVNAGGQVGRNKIVVIQGNK